MTQIIRDPTDTSFWAPMRTFRSVWARARNSSCVFITVDESQSFHFGECETPNAGGPSWCRGGAVSGVWCRPGCPYSAENRSASMGEVLETPALAVRSLSVPISGAEVCSELAKHKAGGPRMHRGPFVPFGSWRSWEMDRGFCFRPRVDSRAARRQARVGRAVCRRPAASRSVRGRGRVWHV
jgi:hypothetical protein